MSIGKIGLITIAAVSALSATAFAQANDTEFKAKQVRLIIGYGTGGAYDQYGRLVARHINRLLPGNPTIIPQNMPGAGSVTAANTIYGNSPKDGSVFGIIATAAVTEPLTSTTSGARYDPRDLTWIGSAAAETSTCVATDKAKVKDYDGLFKDELVVGGVGAGSGTEIYPRALNGLLKTKFKVVSGYPSSSDIFLAMERGEVDGMCASYSAFVRRDAKAIETGAYRVLFQAALKENPTVKAPFLLNLVKDTEQRQALEFLYASQTISRPFIAPPDLPPTILKTLRGAFDATMRDKEFLDEAAKQKLEIDPVSGEELLRVVKTIYDTPKPVIERVKAIAGGI